MMSDFTATADPIPLFASGLTRPRRPSRTIRTPWRWPPSTPTACPTCAWSCSRAIDANGFVFFTNFESAKGRELVANPQGGALLPLEEPPPAGARARPGDAGRQPPRPTPISPRARAAAGSAPGRASSRARSNRASRWRRRSPPTPPNSPSARFRGRPTGRASASTPVEIEFWHDGDLPPPRPRRLHAAAGDGWEKTRLYP